MADDFRRELDMISGPGGVKCRCCNTYNGKHRKVLRRMARRRLTGRRFSKEEIVEAIAEMDFTGTGGGGEPHVVSE